MVIDVDKFYAYCEQKIFKPLSRKFAPLDKMRFVHDVSEKPPALAYVCASGRRKYDMSFAPSVVFNKLAFYDEFDVSKTKDLKHLLTLMLGVFIHEMGHVLFTYFKMLPSETANSSMFCNMIEDPYIERAICSKRKEFAPSVRYLEEHYVLANSPDPSSSKFSQFISNVQYASRGRGPVFSLKEFDEHESKVLEYLDYINSEPLGKERKQKQLEFWDYIKDEVFPDEEPDLEGSSVPGDANRGDDNQENKLGIDVSGVDMEALSEAISEFSPLSEDIDDYDVEHAWLDWEAYIGDLVSGRSDEFLDSLSTETHECVLDVVKELRNLSLLSLDERKYGFNSGKINLSKVEANRHMGNLYPAIGSFSRDVAECPVPDLFFSLLVDNSGSMTHGLSSIATKATLVFGDALDMAEIPFEINGFTASVDLAYTHIVKDADSLYSQARSLIPFLDYANPHSGQCTSRLPEYFGGNTDYHNIKAVGERMLDRHEKDKVLIVMSDGYPCGQTARDIPALVSELSDAGIYIIGIGIGTNSVESLYPHHVVLKSGDDIKKLPTVIKDILVEMFSAAQHK